MQTEASFAAIDAKVLSRKLGVKLYIGVVVSVKIAVKRVSDLASADGAPWRCDVSDDGVHRLHREERWSLKALQAMEHDVEAAFQRSDVGAGAEQRDMRGELRQQLHLQQQLPHEAC